MYAQLVAQLPVPDQEGGMHHQMPLLRTSEDYRLYIHRRVDQWLDSAARPAHATAPGTRAVAPAKRLSSGARLLEEFDDFAVERRNIIRFPAGHQIVVHDHFSIDPIGTGVLDIGPQRGP